MLQIQRTIWFKVNNFFYRSLKNGNVVYIIFFIQVKDSNELSIAAHFFHCHLTGFLKDTSYFLKLGSLQVLPWNLRQLISYLFRAYYLFNQFIKNRQKAFATGNAIYPLPRTIIQITNDNSIFRKEGITPRVNIVSLRYVTNLYSTWLWLSGACI